ncbi:MAG: hypothetical protein WCT40_03310 [Candidatus Magasanikbacteria bacterium]|jgi:hypothetical protein
MIYAGRPSLSEAPSLGRGKKTDREGGDFLAEKSVAPIETDAEKHTRIAEEWKDGFFGDESPVTETDTRLDQSEQDIAALAKRTNMEKDEKVEEEVARTQLFAGYVKKIITKLEDLSASVDDNPALRSVIDDELDHIKAKMDDISAIPVKERAQYLKIHNGNFDRLHEMAIRENIAAVKNPEQLAQSSIETKRPAQQLPDSFTEDELDELIGEPKVSADRSEDLAVTAHRLQQNLHSQPKEKAPLWKKAWTGLMRFSVGALALFGLEGNATANVIKQAERQQMTASEEVEWHEVAPKQDTIVISDRWDVIMAKGGLSAYIPKDMGAVHVVEAKQENRSSPEGVKEDPSTILPGHFEPANDKIIGKRGVYTEKMARMAGGELLKNVEIKKTNVEHQYSRGEWNQLLAIADELHITSKAKNQELNEAERIMQVTVLYNEGKTPQFNEILNHIIGENRGSTLAFRLRNEDGSRELTMTLEGSTFESGKYDSEKPKPLSIADAQLLAPGSPKKPLTGAERRKDEMARTGIPRSIEGIKLSRGGRAPLDMGSAQVTKWLDSDEKPRSTQTGQEATPPAVVKTKTEPKPAEQPVQPAESDDDQLKTVPLVGIKPVVSPQAITTDRKKTIKLPQIEISSGGAGTSLSGEKMGFIPIPMNEKMKDAWIKKTNRAIRALGLKNIDSYIAEITTIDDTIKFDRVLRLTKLIDEVLDRPDNAQAQKSAEKIMELLSENPLVAEALQHQLFKDELKRLRQGYYNLYTKFFKGLAKKN